MNKFLKSLLALLVLLTFSSCVMEVANTNTTKTNGKESFEFNFRSIQQLEGTELVVTLTNGGTIIDSKSHHIVKANEQINFVFDNLLVGDIIKVKAAVIKDGLEIFNSSDTIEIKAGSNEVNLTLTPVKVSLTLSPSPDFKLDTKELLGSKFYITVNGEQYKPIEITEGMTTVSTDIGARKVGEVLTIESKIVKNEPNQTGKDVILYSCTQTTTVTKSENISLDLTRNSIKVSVGSMLPESVGLGSKLLGATYQVTLNKGLDGERNVSYKIKELDRKIEVDLGYFDKDSVIKTISASVITKDSPEIGEQIILKSSTLENFKVTDNEATEGINTIILGLKIPLQVDVYLDPPVEYILGANLDIFVNNTNVASITITQDMLEKQCISHTINVDNESNVGVFITKEGETLFKGEQKSFVQVGTTSIAPELIPNSKMIQVSVTVPVADLTEQPYLSITDANGNPILTPNHRFSITDARDTITTTTAPFQANVGEEIFIKIQNEIIKGPDVPNELLTIFEGSHTISENDNNVIEVNLNQIKKSIKIAPPSNIDLEQYRGNSFIVEANGKKDSIKLGELPPPSGSSSTVDPMGDIYIDLGYVSLDTPIAIKAEINNPVSGSSCSFNDTITFTETSPSIFPLPSMTKNKGVLLFGNEGGRTYVGFNYNSTIQAPETDEQIQSGYAPIKYGDLAITDDGDLWSLIPTGNPKLMFIPHGNGFMKYQNYDLTTAIENIDQKESIVMWSGITSYKDGVLMLGGHKGVQNFYYISQKSNNPEILVSKLYTTTLPALPDEAEICNIAVSNDSIYASFFTGRELSIYKGSINEQAGTIILNKEPIFNTSTYYDSSSNQAEHRPFKSFNFVTTDLAVVDGNLYALLLDITDNYPVSNNSRGALLKIEQDGKITCKGLHETYRTDTDVYDNTYNVFMLNDPLEANNYFLGPRKFIAIKPDELVIADSGAIATSDYKNPSLLKKIKTVNLNDLSIKSSDIDGNIFEGTVLSSTASDFGYSIK